MTTKSCGLEDQRTVPPQATIARVKAFAEAFGITRIANLTGLDRTGIPVVMVCRPNARSSAVFNGKGIDLASAQASALMEAAETWHAENIRLPLRFATFADLRAHQPVVDVDGLPRAPPGPQFDPHLPILWVEGRNLMDDGAIWLPFEIVHANSRVRGPPMTGCFSMSTNGLASGNHFPEAVSHALCEIIERDATSSLASKPVRRARRTAVSISPRSMIAQSSCRPRSLGAGAARRRRLGYHDRRGRLRLPMPDRRSRPAKRAISASALPVIPPARPRFGVRSWKRRRFARPTSSAREKTSSRPTMIPRFSAGGTPRRAR